jgi:hypothetical protein
MTAVRDYLQRVEFQLSGYLGSFGYKKTFAQTWKELANELDTDKYFGKSFRKDFTGLDALRAEVGSQNSPEQKIHIIYEFARKYFTWNGYYGKYTTDGLKELWDKKTGHAGEINLLLVNLFRIFDLEAYPLLVAERDYGSIDTTYPYLDKFNKTVAYVAVGNKYYILDASEKFIPMDIFPYSLLNTYAFLVDKEKFKLFKITSEKGYNLSISLKGELNKAGLLTGTAEMTAKDYARQILEEKLRKSETDYIREDLAEPYPGLVIDSFTHHETDDPDKTLVQKVTFHTELNTNAGYVPFKYNLFSGLSKNPFSSYLRFTNIDFGYPFWVRIEEEVQLPPGCVVEDLPANKKLVTPDGDISIDREIKKAQNRLVIKIQFNQTATMFSHDEYPQLRAFYAAMVKLLDEPVVIKLAK